MTSPSYAIVAYVRNALGEFVEELRRELHPSHAHLPAHFTVLPPRRLQGSEARALEHLEEVCRGVQPFRVALGDAATFVPVTPTVFLRVARGAYRLRELHDMLNRHALGADEQWPYMPHMTIAKFDSDEQAVPAFEIAHRRWSEYAGPRDSLLDELTFVREGSAGHWIDLAPVPLGRSLATHSK